MLEPGHKDADPKPLLRAGLLSRAGDGHAPRQRRSRATSICWRRSPATASCARGDVLGRPAVLALLAQLDSVDLRSTRLPARRGRSCCDCRSPRSSGGLAMPGDRGRTRRRRRPFRGGPRPDRLGKSARSVWRWPRASGEIVACDSQQVYVGMDIGTDKPTREMTASARGPPPRPRPLPPDQPLSRRATARHGPWAGSRPGAGRPSPWAARPWLPPLTAGSMALLSLTRRPRAPPCADRSRGFEGAARLADGGGSGGCEEARSARLCPFELPRKLIYEQIRRLVTNARPAVPCAIRRLPSRC